ncbi:MAG: lipase/esterase [Verrucomicrobia bacterium]|nr:lipase/esterase [Verrucomicrobiota bacterium]
MMTGAAFGQDVAAGTVIDDPTPAGVVIRRDLSYDQNPSQKLDLYYAMGRTTQPRPVIIYLHGGGWQKGSKADGRRVAFHFAAQGYAVACVDYRLTGEAAFPAQLEDVKSSVRWLRSNAERLNLDRDHIGVVGISAGGHLAALTGAMNSTRLFESGGSMEQHSRVQAVVDFFGPIDLNRLYEYSQKAGSPQAAEIAQLIGGDPHRLPVPAHNSNPSLFIDVETPPFLIIHGDNDAIVPLEQSRILYDAAVKNSINARLHVIHGAGHTGPAFVAPDITAIVDRFFAAILKPGDPPVDLGASAITESQAAPQ